MSTENSPLPTLDPQLHEDWDDEEDLRWKAPLAALLAGTQTPLQAAQELDTLLRTETASRLQKLNDYAASHHLTAEDRESGDWTDLYAPNASALAQGFIRSWCRVCTAFYPHSTGQDRLVIFLQELEGLPQWMAPETRPDEEGEVLMTKFWAFGRDWIGLEDEFRRQRDDLGPYTHADSNAKFRWQNFQSAMARVTANQLIYCAPFTALQNLVPYGEPNSKINDFDIDAAAQWVRWPVECRYVYVECLKKDSTEHYWEPWSKQRWALWKLAFKSAAGDGQYSDRTRDIARKAIQQMENIEMEVDEEESVGSRSGSE